MRPRSLRKTAALASALGLIGAAFFSSPPAAAHFVLKQPANWLVQDPDGVPIKLAPCGDEDDGTASAQPTGAVTAFQVGSTIDVTIDEVIFHPGHYRIALAVKDRSELPPEPMVDAGSDTPCGTAAYEDPPVFPVLADNVLPHVTPFSTPQTVQVKLPDGVTCDHCTLQVIEFMSEHPLNKPGGCFYHHCADIKIQTAPVQPGDTVPPGGADGGLADTPRQTGSENGCGCSTPGGSAETGAGAALAIFALFGAARGRRRKRP